MKSITIPFRNLCLAASLAIGLCPDSVAWSKPSIQSIEVSPNSLTTGQNFTIAVTASPDVTRAIVTVDFRPGQPRSLRIPLVRQGLTWTGSGAVPVDLRRQLPPQAGAVMRVLLFDATGQRAKGVVRIGVNVVAVSASLANGILTVAGNDDDNRLVVSRDAAGTILVNAGAVPVAGGVPTIGNTSRIRMLGFEGDDVLLVDDANGSMPPANLLGGEGKDTLTGSANTDELDGGAGNDSLLGGDGDDTLNGGPDNDTVIGGRGADGHFGGTGDDQLVGIPETGVI